MSGNNFSYKRVKSFVTIYLWFYVNFYYKFHTNKV